MYICEKCHDAYAKNEFNCYYKFNEHVKQEVVDCQMCGQVGKAVLCSGARKLAEENKDYWQDGGSKNA